jgi:hypothetical protein
MVHGAGHLADAAANTFQLVALDVGCPFRKRVILLAPALRRWFYGLCCFFFLFHVSNFFSFILLSYFLINARELKMLI